MRHQRVASCAVALAAALASAACESPYAARGDSTPPKAVLPPVAESVTNESITNESITNESITNESVTNESVTNESVTNESVTNESEPSLGDGFVVWESNRSGQWRLWIRDLEGGEPRQLTSDPMQSAPEAHCCPHISPDGSGLVYLRLPANQASYPESGASGALHWVRGDGSGDRVLAPVGRTYAEHRAAVWHNSRQLIFIDGDGRTQLLEVEGGRKEVLIEAPMDAHGYLINGALTHATTGWPSFSAYDPSARQVQPRQNFGGCQPYFSHDGRWGFWIAGAGGPIRAIELATRNPRTLLAKSDPRLPADRGYFYFPMLSADGRLLAFGASNDEHDHHSANYDVFVMEIDPTNLEGRGRPRRITLDSATDRFPDVYSAPLALGRHFGEVPLTVEFPVPAGGDAWSFTVGTTEIGRDGIGASGVARHTFTEAGSFDLVARRGDELLRGAVTVHPARPPEVVRLDVRGGRRLVVHFDEAVDDSDLELALTSGQAIGGHRLDESARSLTVELEEPLIGDDVLVLRRLTDRAQRPNIMPETSLDISPADWPGDPRGLVLLWERNGGLNEVETATGTVVSTAVTAAGRAWFDRHGAMVLQGGRFELAEANAEAVFSACRRTGELTLELSLTPDDPPGDGRILSFLRDRRGRNFVLAQQNSRLTFRLRTAGDTDALTLDLGPLPTGRATWVNLSYTAGRLVATVDGKTVLDTDAKKSGFFRWRLGALVVGDAPGANARPWRGTVEGLAIYNRFMEADEAAENARRYAARRAGRPTATAVRLRAELIDRSRVPTLAEISPYRDAIGVFEYRVTEVLAGNGLAGDGRAGDKIQDHVRVVHRMIADGETLPVARRPKGQIHELRLEPFLEQPQLKSLYLADTLPKASGELYFSDEVEP